MTGLDKITERILADAKEKARGILEGAQEECRKMAEDYAARAEEIRESITERAMREGEDLVARARSASAMARRDILLSAKAQVLDEVFETAKTQICATDYGKYRELLVALLSCALLQQAESEKMSLEMGDEITEFDTFEVFMNENDRTRFGAYVLDNARKNTERRIGSERAAKLRLAPIPADIDGGLILRYGNTETNCSISALLEEMRRGLESRISAILFK